MKKKFLSILVSISMVIGLISVNAVSIEFEDIKTDETYITYEELEAENIKENINSEQIEIISNSPLATETSNVEEITIKPNFLELESYVQNYAFTSNIKDKSGNVISNTMYNQMIKNIENTIESSNWKKEKDGKILTNVPVTNWTRSSNYISFTRRNSASKLAEWNWTTVSSLNKEYNQPEQVWDSSRNENHYCNNALKAGVITSYNNILYDGATWLATDATFSNTTVIEDLYKYEGTFKIDKTYDMSNLYFTLSTVASDRIIYLNDNIYVFIYPTCLKESISNNANNPYYFMNFLCFWTGTIATVTNLKTFYGIPAETAYRNLNRFSDAKPYEQALNFTGWNLNATKDNVGSTIYNSYLLAKNNPNFDGEYTITVIASDIAGHGGMYRPVLFMEYKDSVITYLGNGATGGSTKNQTKTYGVDLHISENGYVKEGYSFIGWNTKADGSGESYSPNDVFKREDGLRLYAQWKINQYPVTYIDKNSNGTELGRTSKKINYNTPVHGSDLGSSTADNAYYNQYRYISDTSATVNTNGATVYRIFEFCKTEKESHLTWNDNNDADKLRPDKYTLKLKQNGVVIDEVELPSNQTDYVFENLPEYDTNGNPYNYELETIVSDRYKTDVDDNGNLIVEDYQPANFSVTIPKKIILNGNTGKASYTVSVNGIFYYNDTLTIKPNTTFTLTDRSNISSMQADVTQTKNSFTKEDLPSSANGNISVNRPYFSGSWKGNFNFEIKFVMLN